MKTGLRGIEVLNAETLLSYDEVAQLFGVNRSTIYRWVKSGDFPQPVKVGRSSKFKATDLPHVTLTGENSNK